MNLELSEEKFAKFQAAARKRRILKRKNESKVSEMLQTLSLELCKLTGTKVAQDLEEYEAYKAIKDVAF